MSASFTTSLEDTFTDDLKEFGKDPERSKNSVSTGPGHTAVTKMPLLFSSVLNASDKLYTYYFEAAYTANPGCGAKAAADATLRILLPFEK